jgi:hypothetical protein
MQQPAACTLASVAGTAPWLPYKLLFDLPAV